MANVKYKDFVDGLSADTIGGSEKIAVVDSGVTKYQTPDSLKSYILAALTASGVVTPTTGDALLVERSGAEGTYDLDGFVEYINQRLFSDSSETSPAGGDAFVFDRGGGNIYKCDIDMIVDYVRTEIGTLGAQITALSSATLADSDEYVVSQGGAAAKATFTAVAARVHDQFTGYLTGLTAATSPVDANELYVLQGASARKMTLTVFANTYLANEIDVEDFSWGMTEADPALSGDMFLMERGGTRYKVDADTLATFTGSSFQSTVLDFSGLAVASAPTASDDFVIDVTGTPKSLSYSALAAELWISFNAYVTALDPVSTTTATDLLYCIQGGTAKYVTPAVLSSYFNVTSGDVSGPVSTTENNIPQWDSATKTLKDGLSLATSVRFDGSESDSVLASEKAVSEAIEDIANLRIDSGTDIGADITDADLFIVDDGGGGTNRKCAASRLKTYIVSAGVYDTIYIPAKQMVPVAASPCASLASNEYATNNVNLEYLAFDGTALSVEAANFAIAMPGSWDGGTIKAKFYWSSASGSSVSDTVQWEIKAGALTDSDAIDAALGTAVVISDSVTAANGTDLQITSATPAMTVAGSPALEDLIVFEVARNADGTDDMAEDAWLFGVAIQIYKNQSVSAW